MLLFFFSYLSPSSYPTPEKSIVQIDLELSLDKIPVFALPALRAVLLAIPDYLDVRAEAATAGSEVCRD